MTNDHPRSRPRRYLRTGGLALTLALLPALLHAQPGAPATFTTVKATSSAVDAVCVGCPVTTQVPAANSGARLATITFDAYAAPSVTTNKLYNISGGLYFNGALLATGSSVSGTLNTIGVFTGAAAIGNSIITQNAGATTITVGGSLNVSGPVAATAFVGSGASLTAIPTTALTGNFVATVGSGTGITSSVTSGSAAATVISLNNTAVTPAAYGGTVPVSFTVDQQGRLTAAASTALTFTVGGTLGTWDTTLVPIRAGIAGVYAGHGGAINSYFGTNFAYNGGFKYLTTEAAQKLQADATGFTFSTAPSGTAGNAITFTDRLVVQATGLSIGGANLTDAVATPTIASGFAGWSVTGKAFGFVVFGAAGPTTGTVNFNTTFANAPVCVAMGNVHSDVRMGGATTTSVTINTNATNTAIQVICRGY